MGLGDLFGSIINLVFCKFTLILIFIALVIVGAVVSRSSKNKDHKEAERSEAEQMWNYVATFSSDPWNSKENEDGQEEDSAARPKGKLESFYDGKTSRWGNIRKIIYKEKRTMLERAELTEQKHDE